MGKRGPQRTPLKLLEASGSWLAKTRTEPNFTPGLPMCPDWLDEFGRDYWTFLETQLVTSGVVTLDNADPLARLCALRSIWQRLYDKLRNPRTKKQQYAVTALLKIEAQVQRLEREFGLTPASRTGVAPAHKEDGNDKAEFFES